VGAKQPLYRRIARWILFTVLGWIALTVTLVAVLRFVDPFGSAFMIRDRWLAWHNNDSAFVFRWQWVDREQISTPMQLAVIASEDQTFPIHNGFDFKSINQAFDERERGRRVRGASTITQQVAKNIFLWPEQSWLRKGIEAYFTVLIEALWPKERILEVYLNVAEFGRGVYGVESAARTYFRKSAARLDYSESALLAAVLPNPKRLKVSAPSLYVRTRQHWIEEQMADLGGTGYLRALK
jgi:monofunctional biosynthetic peptidoglycan transglycosylase